MFSELDPEGTYCLGSQTAATVQVLLFLRRTDHPAFAFLERRIEHGVPATLPDRHPFYGGSNPDGCTHSFEAALFYTSGLVENAPQRLRAHVALLEPVMNLSA